MTDINLAQAHAVSLALTLMVAGLCALASHLNLN